MRISIFDMQIFALQITCAKHIKIYSRKIFISFRFSKEKKKYYSSKFPHMFVDLFIYFYFKGAITAWGGLTNWFFMSRGNCKSLSEKR